MDEDSSLSSVLVSIIAIGGFGLLLGLAATLWSSVALRWLESARERLGVDPSSISSPSALDRSVEPVTWPDEKVRAALIQCVQSLAPINANLDPLDPIRDGECGTPTPVLLKRLGNQNKVEFDPPLVVNCQMVAALYHWLNDSVQPAASDVFGSPVRKIIGSSYACRTAYNDPNARLSQHAFANAVDLPVFVLANGREIDVTRGWGATKRELVAAAKTSAVVSAISGTTKTPSNKTASTDLVKVSTSQAPHDAKKAHETADSSSEANLAEATFLRMALRGGCEIFTTMLGPEFNDVHRTHFHLDLQDRGTAKLCK